MKLGVQYYRPPFPEIPYWEDDLKRIKDTGIDILQFWILWGWVESKPGQFDFDDYDRLVELAAKNDLKLVISTIAEIQPLWIHREVPGSEMIDHLGHRVISSHRGECHFGMTPGGCTDHPKVWERMSGFLAEVVNRYNSLDHLVGWDAWNELRWNVQADGLVCFCPHTIDCFHRWLESAYGNLENLNIAWKRRYRQWDEVRPGKIHDRTYTEMMAWQRFITWRANQHGKARYDLIKKLDSVHPITVHAGDPTPLTAGISTDYTLSRGNDWDYSDDLDGVGCSSFPKLCEIDDADFISRVTFAKSAAGQKRLWLSEVQGGQAAIGMQKYPPVDAVSQQRWIWQGQALGAEKLLFWCWRDEVFGRESSGFGIIGNDGHAEERLDALRHTNTILERYGALFDEYQQDPPFAGVFFSPNSYYLHWASEGHAQIIRDSVEGYCRALVRNSIPYTVIEEKHLEKIFTLKVLFLPRTIVTDEKVERALIEFVQNGGTLVCESECGSFSPEGFYRYPSERFLSRLLSGSESGRRSVSSNGISVEIPPVGKLKLSGMQWMTPWRDFPGRSWAGSKQETLIGEAPVGKGKVIFISSYLGDLYQKEKTEDFEKFLREILDGAGYQPVLEPDGTQNSRSYIVTGHSGPYRLIFLFSPTDQKSCLLHSRNEVFCGRPITELLSGRQISVSPNQENYNISISNPFWGISVFTDAPVCRAENRRSSAIS